MIPNGKYSQEDIDRAVKMAADSTETRVKLIIGLEVLEKAFDRLEKNVSGRETACQAKWRKDILYFAGIPGIIYMAILVVTNWGKITGG